MMPEFCRLCGVSVCVAVCVAVCMAVCMAMSIQLGLRSLGSLPTSLVTCCDAWVVSAMCSPNSPLFTASQYQELYEGGGLRCVNSAYAVSIDL